MRENCTWRVRSHWCFTIPPKCLRRFACCTKNNKNKEAKAYTGVLSDSVAVYLVLSFILSFHSFLLVCTFLSCTMRHFFSWECRLSLMRTFLTGHVWLCVGERLLKYSSLADIRVLSVLMGSDRKV